MRDTIDNASELTRTSPFPTRQHGRGLAWGHFGEILQGSFRDNNGAICRALVTIRCDRFGAMAIFELDGTSEVTVIPAQFRKAQRAAENTLAYLGLTRGGGRLTVISGTPAGIGAGSSTSDVVAAIRAVDDAFGAGLVEMEFARLAVDTEVAVDPIMLCSRPEVLFAHRHGTVLEHFAGALPLLRVIGITDGPPVDTVALTPAPYSRVQIDEFESLRARLRLAIASRDVRGLAAVATRSAQINQSHLPKPSLPMLLEIVRHSGAAGLSVSHSGSAVGILFDGQLSENDQGVLQAHNLLAEAGFARRWTFCTGDAS